jgi:hypothetical protein
LFLAAGIEIYFATLIFSRQIHDRSKHGADDYPKQLIPIEERQADPIGLYLIIKGRPKYGDELDEKEQVPPAPAVPLFI